MAIFRNCSRLTSVRSVNESRNKHNGVIHGRSEMGAQIMDPIHHELSGGQLDKHRRTRNFMRKE